VLGATPGLGREMWIARGVIGYLDANRCQMNVKRQGVGPRYCRGRYLSKLHLTRVFAGSRTGTVSTVETSKTVNISNAVYD